MSSAIIRESFPLFLPAPSRAGHFPVMPVGVSLVKFASSHKHKSPSITPHSQWSLRARPSSPSPRHCPLWWVKGHTDVDRAAVSPVWLWTSPESAAVDSSLWRYEEGGDIGYKWETQRPPNKGLFILNLPETTQPFFMCWKGTYIWKHTWITTPGQEVKRSRGHSLNDLCTHAHIF